MCLAVSDSACDAAVAREEGPCWLIGFCAGRAPSSVRLNYTRNPLVDTLIAFRRHQPWVGGVNETLDETPGAINLCGRLRETHNGRSVALRSTEALASGRAWHQRFGWVFTLVRVCAKLRLLENRREDRMPVRAVLMSLLVAEVLSSQFRCRRPWWHQTRILACCDDVVAFVMMLLRRALQQGCSLFESLSRLVLTVSDYRITNLLRFSGNRSGSDEHFGVSLDWTLFCWRV